MGTLSHLPVCFHSPGLPSWLFPSQHPASPAWGRLPSIAVSNPLLVLMPSHSSREMPLSLSLPLTPNNSLHRPPSHPRPLPIFSPPNKSKQLRGGHISTSSSCCELPQKKKKNADGRCLGRTSYLRALILLANPLSLGSPKV